MVLEGMLYTPLQIETGLFLTLAVKYVDYILPLLLLYIYTHIYTYTTHTHTHTHTVGDYIPPQRHKATLYSKSNLDFSDQ